jgi:hypothetical protein|nr:hypothetical protein [Pseudonocardiaceae bacterium]
MTVSWAMIALEAEAEAEGGIVPDRLNRRMIPATCQVHGGAAGFTNLVVTREAGRIVFDPHVDRSCVISVDEEAARLLYEALGQWLG